MRGPLGGSTQSLPQGGSPVLYMIVEVFFGGRPEAVYERVRRQGRLAPPGLEYVARWVSLDGAMCYQVMECEDRTLLDKWIAAWTDLVEFSVTPVMTSAEAAAQVYANVSQPSCRLTSACSGGRLRSKERRIVSRLSSRRSRCAVR